MNIFTNKNIITYTVNKERTNNLYISVQNGEVVINAPWYATNMQIQRVVEEKKQWILSKIEEYEKVKANKTFTKLDNIKVLGKEFDLVVKYDRTQQLPGLNFYGKQIKVTLPEKYNKMENSEIVGTIMNKMYEKIAESEIERAMEKARYMMKGIAPEDYKIKRMRNPLTLAKCENDIITINPDIVMYSREIIDYVIIHQFCHLKYKNHTKSFYNMLKTYIPNYEEISSKLSGIAY